MRKKGQMQDLGDFLVAVFLILIIAFLFSMTTSFEKEKIGYEIDESNQKLSKETFFLNYLRTPVIVEGETMTIGDIISMVDVEDGKGKRTGVFQKTTKELFESEYPLKTPEWQGVVPWWIRVYDSDEEIIPANGKYFEVSPVRGYAYGPANCHSGNGDLTIYNVPKIDKGYTKMVFCILKSYAMKVK